MADHQKLFEMESERLISLVQSFPIIYDKKREDFKDPNKKENSWVTIARHMNMSVEECQGRWKNLRERFTREKRNLSKESISGYESSERRWPYFNAMSFLDAYIRHRRRWPRYSANTSHVSRPPVEVVLGNGAGGEDHHPSSPLFVNIPASPSPRASSSSSQSPTPGPALQFPELTPCTSLDRDRIPRAPRKRGAVVPPGADIEQALISHISHVSELLANTTPQDEDDIFCRMVTAELRSITDIKKRRRLKRKLFEVLMDSLDTDEQNTSSLSN